MESTTNISKITSSGGNLSSWLEMDRAPEFNGLKKDIEVDVCVIGGGIAGVTAAYLLTLEGKSVALIEVNSLDYRDLI